MDSIVQDLMNQVATGDNLTAISNSVGGDPNAVKSALSMGLPMIMGSMANSASKPGGADMLMNMLSQSGGSNPMDNLGGFLSNPGTAGAGMASSLLGSQMGGIQNAISQKTGLPPAVVGKVLEMATPLVMGYVAKKFSGQKMDQKGLTDMLGEQSKLALQSSPDAASLAKDLLGGQAESSGFLGSVMKIFKG